MPDGLSDPKDREPAPHELSLDGADVVCMF